MTKSPVWTGFDPANFAQWNRLGKLPVIPRVKERTAPPGCVRAGLRQWQEPGHVRHGKHTTPTGSVHRRLASPASHGATSSMGDGPNARPRAGGPAGAGTREANLSLAARGPCQALRGTWASVRGTPGPARAPGQPSPLRARLPSHAPRHRSLGICRTQPSPSLNYEPPLSLETPSRKPRQPKSADSERPGGPTSAATALRAMRLGL